jgi:hypothetical protein
MRSLLLVLVSVIGLSACGDIVPLTPDAAPCSLCDENATCSNNACVCDTGWEGTGESCTDVNECMTNNGGCDPNAACFNNDGGRNCGCNTGFVGDGTMCRQVWTLRGSAPIRLSNVINGQTNEASATVVGGTRIFFAPEIGGDGDISNHFMRSFDISTMSFNVGGSHAIPPANMSDFCACGFGQVFVGTATEILMFGSDGFRYNVANNTWTQITTYTQTIARGESGGAFEANNGTVYMIGGRSVSGSDLNTALRFNLAGGGTFGSEPGTLPSGVEGSRAWAPAGNNVVYVAGGFWADNSRRHLVSHATGTNTWTSLPDAPADIGSPVGMGDWQGKVWITTRQQIFFYDIATMTWRAPISLPPGFITAVTAGTRTFGLIQNNDMLEVHELTAIE